MAEIIEVTDLPAALQADELVDLMVDGANASASRVAPCLTDSPTDDQLAEAKLVLVGAVKRWAEAGSGAFQSQSAGPFAVSTDTRTRSGFRLWPSEIDQLQELCSTDALSGGAFEVDTIPSGAGVPGVYGEDYWWTTPDSYSTEF